jgi:hypothetical protein
VAGGASSQVVQVLVLDFIKAEGAGEGVDDGGAGAGFPAAFQAGVVVDAYGVPWKLGTPLPTVPAGWTLEAEPNWAAMKGMAVGTTVRLTPVSLPASPAAADVASASAAATTALASDANSAGYVNMQVVPGVIPGSCTTQFLGNQGSITTAVGQSYSTDAYDSLDFFYGQGQSSSVSIGYSASGSYGSFSIDGNTSVSSTGGVPFDTQYGKTNVYWRTQFEWGLWKTTCVSKFSTIYYQTCPYYWQPNSNIYHPGNIALPPYCTPERANTSPYYDTTTASTIHKAFSVLGFEADATTGYNTTAKMTWNYGEKGYLCGNTPTPGGTIGRGEAIP